MQPDKLYYIEHIMLLYTLGKNQCA